MGLEMNFYQNDNGMPDSMAHFACAYMVLAASKPAMLSLPWTQKQLIDAWFGCINTRAPSGDGLKTIISGDKNKDGILGDAEDELIIQYYQDLFDYMKLPLKYIEPSSMGLPMNEDGRLLPVKTPFDINKYWVMEQWKYKILHFVRGDGTGRKPVWYDPIKGGSQTVLHGSIYTLRVFEITI